MTFNNDFASVDEIQHDNTYLSTLKRKRNVCKITFNLN